MQTIEQNNDTNNVLHGTIENDADKVLHGTNEDPIETIKTENAHIDLQVIPPVQTAENEIVMPKQRKPRKKKSDTISDNDLNEQTETAKPRKRKVAGNTELLAGIFSMVHATCCTLLKCPELAPTQEENIKLAKAVEDVANEYDLQVDSKQAAWTNLIFAMGSVYGTRLFMYQMMMRDSKNEKSTG